MRRVPVALAAGLVLIVAALVVVLSRAPLTLAGTNGVVANPKVAKTGGQVTICRNEGTLPANTSAIRVSLSANVGPKVTVRVQSGKTVVAEGSRPPGWGLAETVTTPVKPIPHAIRNVRICTRVGAAAETIEIKGTIIKGVVALRVEYLRAGPSSWWSLASSVADHIGLGRSPTGTWIAWLAVALMLAIAGLTSRLLVQEMR
jgi:hypothetical protein